MPGEEAENREQSSAPGVVQQEEPEAVNLEPDSLPAEVSIPSQAKAPSQKKKAECDLGISTSSRVTRSSKK